MKKETARLMSRCLTPSVFLSLSANVAQLVAQNLNAVFIEDKKIATLTRENPKTDEKIADWLIYRTADDGSWDICFSAEQLLLLCRLIQIDSDKDINLKRNYEYTI